MLWGSIVWETRACLFPNAPLLKPYYVGMSAIAYIPTPYRFLFATKNAFIPFRFDGVHCSCLAVTPFSASLHFKHFSHPQKRHCPSFCKHRCISDEENFVRRPCAHRNIFVRCKSIVKVNTFVRIIFVVWWLFFLVVVLLACLIRSFHSPPNPQRGVNKHYGGLTLLNLASLRGRPGVIAVTVFVSTHNLCTNKNSASAPQGVASPRALHSSLRELLFAFKHYSQVLILTPLNFVHHTLGLAPRLPLATARP